MRTDPRCAIAKILIEKKEITKFRQIFEIIPKSNIAHALRTNNNRMTRLIEHVDQFKLAELFRISEFLDVDYKLIISMVNAQHLGNNKWSKEKFG